MMEARVDAESESSSDESESESDSEETKLDTETETLVAEPGGGGHRKTGRKRKRLDDSDSEDESAHRNKDEFTDLTIGANYDTYVKHPVRTSSTFKDVGREREKEKERVRMKMFPYYERRRRGRRDAYGELVDVEMWVRRGKELHGNADGGGGEDAAAAAAADGMEQIQIGAQQQLEKEREKEVPSKFVSSSLTLDVRCSLMYIDFEGLNDGRAVKTILPQVNPRKMVSIFFCLGMRGPSDPLVDTCGRVTAKYCSAYREL